MQTTVEAISEATTEAIAETTAETAPPLVRSYRAGGYDYGTSSHPVSRPMARPTEPDGFSVIDRTLAQLAANAAKGIIAPIHEQAGYLRAEIDRQRGIFSRIISTLATIETTIDGLPADSPDLTVVEGLRQQISDLAATMGEQQLGHSPNALAWSVASALSGYQRHHEYIAEERRKAEAEAAAEEAKRQERAAAWKARQDRIGEITAKIDRGEGITEEEATLLGFAPTV